jgi:NADH dehydrogenase
MQAVMILVAGSTGLLGTEICTRLCARGLPTRALVRPGSPREATICALGATVVHGDLKDPASVGNACRGASVVITTVNSMLARQRGDSLESVDRDGSLTLLRAATAAGVEQFVFTSVSPLLPANNPFIRYKREVESAVRASSLRWTILQPAAFMEVHAGSAAGWDFRAGRARFAGSGQAPVAFVSIRDVAAIAVAAVGNPACFGRNLHITGPEPLTTLEAIAIAERVTGRTFTSQRIPTAVLRVLRVALRPFSPHLASLMAMGIGLEEGEPVAMKALFDEFGIKPTTFEDYARGAARHS